MSDFANFSSFDEDERQMAKEEQIHYQNYRYEAVKVEPKSLVICNKSPIRVKTVNFQEFLHISAMS